MRSLRHELLSMTVVFSLPVALALGFPYAAISFRARAVPTERAASAAFVTLSQEDEDAALRSAKSAWLSDESTDQRMRLRLPLGELPEEAETPLRDIAAIPHDSTKLQPATYRLPPWSPSLRAEGPVRLPPETEEPRKSTFPREELLKIN